MKTKFVILSILTTGILFNYPVSAQEIIRNIWHNPESINFPASYRYDDKNEMHYLFSNDSENLYINLVMVSDASQIRSLRYGLTVYVDPEGKGKKQSYIKFLAPELSPREAPQFRPDPSDPRAGRIDQRKLMASRVTEVEISGFGNKKPVKSEISGLKDFLCSVSIDEQVKLMYGITIPLKKISSGKGAGQFSIGVESGFLNMEDMAANRQRMQSGGTPGERPAGQRPQAMRQGGGERPGAAVSPEERQQRMQEMQKLTVPVKMWAKSVELAKSE